MGSIEDIYKETRHTGHKMIGRGSSKVGEGAGRLLAEKLAEENAKPATTPEERAWRRFIDPERRKNMLKEAREAALAVARCEP